jgi:hypothetical protein
MSSRSYKIAAWAAAGLAFGIWQFYDYKHPKEFTRVEQDSWNEKIKRENLLGTKPPNSTLASSNKDSPK